MSGRINAYFVCGGDFHDFDLPRIEVLRLLNEHERIRVRVAEDYRDTDALQAADFLITYTCNLRPHPDQEQALADFVGGGKRWFALHATNSVIDLRQDGLFDSPRIHQTMMQVLGSQFVAHPPIMRYPVTVAEGAADHWLVRGIPAFSVEDELYLSEYFGERTDLLVTRFGGQAQEGFVETDWTEERDHSVMYLHPYGSGEVLYLTPGHARGRYDMQPLIEEYPFAERGAWMVQTYYELLRRGIRWAAGMAR